MEKPLSSRTWFKCDLVHLHLGTCIQTNFK
jgi:hypothetical protein